MLIKPSRWEAPSSNSRSCSSKEQGSCGSYPRWWFLFQCRYRLEHLMQRKADFCFCGYAAGNDHPSSRWLVGCQEEKRECSHSGRADPYSGKWCIHQHAARAFQYALPVRCASRDSTALQSYLNPLQVSPFPVLKCYPNRGLLFTLE